MGEKRGREPDGERWDVNNDVSGNVNGPVGQFGSVHGDVNMHWTEKAAADPEEQAFRAQYRARQQAEWAAQDAKRRRERRKERGDGGFGFLLFGVLAWILLATGGDATGWGIGFGVLAVLCLLGAVIP
ncbi:hypothetical protein AB0J38_20795 [Streptomyces sp. NPDC050095]|uniref:hypothetical protein n=1 Tax=unclassified Streptomyces TaxID=2593676 RepID=UPI00342C7716